MQQTCFIHTNKGIDISVIHRPTECMLKVASLYAMMVRFHEWVQTVLEWFKKLHDPSVDNDKDLGAQRMVSVLFFGTVDGENKAAS